MLDKVVSLAAHLGEGWRSSSTEAIPPSIVVSQLELSTGAEQKLLFEYLHALYLHDVHLGSAFHGRLLSLYGEHRPDLLLDFLRGVHLESQPLLYDV